MEESVEDMAIPGMCYLRGLLWFATSSARNSRWTGSGRTIGSLENDGGLCEGSRMLGVYSDRKPTGVGKSRGYQKFVVRVGLDRSTH